MLKNTMNILMIAASKSYSTDLILPFSQLLLKNIEYFSLKTLQTFFR